MNESEWTVERHPGFAFRGPNAGQALADLVIMRHLHETPVVVAVEREDNPGVSVTNGAEQLAAAVLAQHFPGYAGGPEPPFALIEHYPAVLDVDGHEKRAATFQEVLFDDFEIRRDRTAPRIGEVKEWRTVALELAVAEEEELELEKAVAPRRGLAR